MGGCHGSGWGKGLEESARRVIVCGVHSVAERASERERNTYMKYVYVYTQTQRPSSGVTERGRVR